MSWWQGGHHIFMLLAERMAAFLQRVQKPKDWIYDYPGYLEIAVAFVHVTGIDLIRGLEFARELGKFLVSRIPPTPP